MIADFLDYALNGVLGLGVANIGLVAGCGALAVYWRRAQSLATFFGSWLGKIVFAAVAIGVLNALGVIQEISVARAIEIVAALISSITDFLPPGLA